jgi:hydroxymethylglutaryl-CoA lyase
MDGVTIVEVGPRDGFQSVPTFIPTDRKVAVLRALLAAGLQRIEVGSFVSRTALPQMADIRDLLSSLGPVDAALSVLVPNLRGATLALEAGVRDLVVVVSASEAHNARNVRMSVGDSLADIRRIAAEAGSAGRIRVNVATAFHCPFEGRTPVDRVVRVLDALVGAVPEGSEFALCDTTGRALPAEVSAAFEHCDRRFPGVTWAYHAHDTFGLGCATSWAAYRQGVHVLDASIAGLGGCPFAPGATGNVATEDLVYLFEGSGIPTGVDPARLLEAAHMTEAIDGAEVGGRVRAAVGAGAWPV